MSVGWLSRMWSNWRSALLIVKPETIICWHRQGFRWYWTWKVRSGRIARFMSRRLLQAAPQRISEVNDSTAQQIMTVIDSPCSRDPAFYLMWRLRWRSHATPVDG